MVFTDNPVSSAISWKNKLLHSNRLIAFNIFEDKFLLFELGKTPWVAITQGEYMYILLIVLIFLATLASFRKTLKDQTAQGMNMKTTLYIMLALITYSSFTIAAGVGIYWITSNLFTIIQNLLVERKKVK